VQSTGIQRQPAELTYRDELSRLRDQDSAAKPPGWLLSPRSVEQFVLGEDNLGITPKFVAPRQVVTRIITSLATQRGAMLIGEPGTAKSWLSELLCAAICDDSTIVVQGGAIETVQQLLYSWNAPVVERSGPCLDALIPGPVYRGMNEGKMVRFEEIARTSTALQDALLSILSERSIAVPELDGENRILYAREGFNLIGTSNTTDEGVNRMSAALKRRMNFETIHPISHLEDEITVVLREAGRLLETAGVHYAPDADIVRVLVTLFHELRNGQTLDGRSTDRLAAANMSTAEAVSVTHAMGVYAFYYRDGPMDVHDLANFLIGAAIKDNLNDLKRMTHYFETEVSRKSGPVWLTLYEDWKQQIRR
jgi:MoxR-like ATPase